MRAGRGLWAFGLSVLLVLLAVGTPLTPAKGADLARLESPTIQVRDAYTLPAGRDVRSRPVYLTLTNATARGDALIGASSPYAEKVLLQRTVVNDLGVAMITPLQPQRIPLPARSEVVLSPGHLHLLLQGLHQELYPGLELPLKLVFEHAPAMYITVAIGAPRKDAK